MQQSYYIPLLTIQMIFHDIHLFIYVHLPVRSHCSRNRPYPRPILVWLAVVCLLSCPSLQVKGGKKAPRYLLDRDEVWVIYKPPLRSLKLGEAGGSWEAGSSYLRSPWVPMGTQPGVWNAKTCQSEMKMMRRYENHSIEHGMAEPSNQGF